MRGRTLSRTSAHRKALRQNIANSLFIYGRIVTTIEKAKETKSFAEKIITLAKKGLLKKILINQDTYTIIVKYSRN